MVVSDVIIMHSSLMSGFSRIVLGQMMTSDDDKKKKKKNRNPHKA